MRLVADNERGSHGVSMTAPPVRGKNTINIEELKQLDDEEASRILKRYLGQMAKIVGSYFDVDPDSPLSEFEAEARRHPIFLLKADGPISAQELPPD